MKTWLVVIWLGLPCLLGCAAIETARQNWMPDTQVKIKMVYLAPDSIPAGQDIPGGSLALSVRGVHIVYDMAELKQWTAQQSPRVIMVHQASLAELDAKWLAAQYNDGVTIASFNLTLGELYALLGSSLPASSGFQDGWQRNSFYSYAFARANQGTRGMGNDNLGPNGTSPDQLLFALSLNQ